LIGHRGSFLAFAFNRFRQHGELLLSHFQAFLNLGSRFGRFFSHHRCSCFDQFLYILAQDFYILDEFFLDDCYILIGVR